MLLLSDESSEFALRSYLYLLLHAVVGGPAAWWYGAAQGKVTLMHSILFYMLEILSMFPCISSTGEDTYSSFDCISIEDEKEKILDFGAMMNW